MKSVPFHLPLVSIRRESEWVNMNHHFDVEEAVQHGILEAVLLQNIRYWICKNIANKKHFNKGNYWTYNSAKAFAELFPYASQHQISRSLKRLEEKGVLLSDNFNDSLLDHTKWYTVPDSANLLNRSCKIAKTLIDTNINTDSNIVINDDVSFELFWKAYPRKTNKGFARTVFKKLKPDEYLVKRMLFAIEQQKKSEQWKNSQYIPHPSTWLNGERWEDEVTSIKQTSIAGAF